MHDDSLYSTVRWAKVRAIKLGRQPMCERCLEEGRLTQGEIVHHIVEVSQDKSKALDIDNLQTLCRKCHAITHGYEKNFMK